MRSITTFFNWSWLLVVALFVPVALPAGGGEINKRSIYLSRSTSTFLTENNCQLRASPYSDASVIRNIPIGTHIRILRRLRTSEFGEWIQVHVISAQGIDPIALPRRGWINV